MKTALAVLAGWACAGSAWAQPLDPAAVRAAIDKSLRRIEQGVVNYPKQRQCFSCHHQAMAVFSMTAARERGLAIDEDLLKKVVDFSLRSFRNKSTIAKGQGVGGDSTSVVYALHTFAAVERPYDDTMAALVKYLVAKQRPDGSWPVPAQRPPTMSSLFTNTGLAMQVLKTYTPPDDAADAKDLQEKVDLAFARGRTFLLTSKPSSMEDKVFQLRGLVDAGAKRKDIDPARDRLVGEQKEDGSWAQLQTMTGDAYATATALVALRHAGLETGHEAYQKGLKYLLDTQQEDGAWIVKTRSRPLQIFFDNGDAGGKSQFISYAATGWATLALLETLPYTLPMPRVASAERN